jgi:hypothetical protein
MLPERLDTTLAHKAIALSMQLSGTEKRVASAIIDSFNRKTGQCDPSFDRIAHLLGISRRSVIRAVKKLEMVRFILKIRHGGKSHRNAYLPNWRLFRGLDNEWSARQKTRHWDSVQRVSPLQCQERPGSGGNSVTQTTFLKNQSKETTGSNVGEEKSASLQSSTSSGSNTTVASVEKKTPRYVSHSAALAAAERRWNTDLLKRYVDNKQAYVQIVDAITPEMIAAATQAEVNRRGAGIAYIQDALMVAEIERSLEEFTKLGDRYEPVL